MLRNNYITVKRKADLQLNISSKRTNSLENNRMRMQTKKRAMKPELTDSSSDLEDPSEKLQRITREELPLETLVNIKEEALTSNPEIINLEHELDLESNLFDTLDVAANEPQSSETQKQILRTLKNIQATLREHTRLLRQIQVGPGGSLQISMPSLPVKSIQELQNWELFLSNTENFSKCVKHFMCRIGVDFKKSTRHLLSTLLTNDVAQEFNWAGRPPKRTFKELQTVTLILCVIKGNPQTRDTPASEIEDTIKDWLKFASFRSKYKTTENRS